MKPEEARAIFDKRPLQHSDHSSVASTRFEDKAEALKQLFEENGIAGVRVSKIYHVEIPSGHYSEAMAVIRAVKAGRGRRSRRKLT